MVPDHFLRRWDPVTVLFPAATGPAAAGRRTQPERYATLSPPKPGAWTWLTPTTLQFRPTEPWEPLRRETVTVGGAATTLVPLLPRAHRHRPAGRRQRHADLDTVALTFDQPVDLAALARLLTIDIRPQTGVREGGTETLTAGGLRPAAGGAHGAGDAQTVLVVLHRPSPDGRIATLHLRLSDEPGDGRPDLRAGAAAPPRRSAHGQLLRRRATTTPRRTA